LGFTAGSIVLDVGFGQTSELLEISRVVGPNGIVYGVESRKDMVAKALEKLGNARNVRPVVGQADHIPLSDESVDYVIFKGILHEVRAIPKLLLEAKRVCKSNGTVFILDFTPFPVNWLRSSNLKARLKNPAKIFSPSLDKHPGFSKADLAHYFVRTGFSLERYENIELEGGFGGKRVPMFLAEARKLRPSSETHR
jgi:ubiquinone/menaquinone biosynthesis C-methylase UbiE